MSPIIVDPTGSPVEGRIKAYADAAVAQLEAVWMPARVHKLGRVPDSPATPYAVVSVSAGAAENTRGDGTHGSKVHRIIVMVVGKDAPEIEYAIDKADDAYQDAQLIAPGYDTTPATAELEANIVRDPDGGVLLTATQTYRFHAYPA